MQIAVILSTATYPGKRKR
jgi:hypothetical protein